jgi:hypothetical protein
VISSGNRRYNQIGLDRLVRLIWLEKTASLILGGNDLKSIKDALCSDLKGSFRSSDMLVRGSLDKSITILIKVWLKAPRGIQDLQRNGLEQLRRLPKPQHLAIHWGMVMATYPFWGAVACHAGRLLKLQGFAAASHVQRRVREQYGERETVSRRTRYVLRSFLDWGVLNEIGKKGIYYPNTPINIENPQETVWLLEAYLNATPAKSASLKELFGSPYLFPFNIKPINAEVISNNSINVDIVRHNLDHELITLKKH